MYHIFLIMYHNIHFQFFLYLNLFQWRKTVITNLNFIYFKLQASSTKRVKWKIDLENGYILQMVTFFIAVHPCIFGTRSSSPSYVKWLYPNPLLSWRTYFSGLRTRINVLYLWTIQNYWIIRISRISCNNWILVQ